MVFHQVNVFIEIDGKINEDALYSMCQNQFIAFMWCYFEHFWNEPSTIILIYLWWILANYWLDLRKMKKNLLKTRSFWILFNLMLREFNWNGHFDHWYSHILTKSWWSLFVEKKSPMTPQITSEHSIQMSMKYDTNYCQRNNKFIVEAHCEGVMEQIWLFSDTAPCFI